MICKNGGAYKAEVAFFSVKSPTIQLLVDSQVVTSTCPSKRPKKASTSKNKILVATTCCATIMLPVKSHVVVRIQGEHPIQGTLTLIRDPIL